MRVRFFFVVISLLPLTSAVARAAQIVDLYSTGIGSNGLVLSPGAPDPHYAFISGPQAPVGTSQGIAETTTNPWQANGPHSDWIGVTATGANNVATGTYNFETTFSLPSNAVLSSVVITFESGSDNNLSEVDLNHHPTGLSTPSQYSLSKPQTIDSANAEFQTGTNSLDFYVLNVDDGGGPNPSGLRVDGIEGTFSTTPEPTSLGLLALVGTVAALHRRRSCNEVKPV